MLQPDDALSAWPRIEGRVRETLARTGECDTAETVLVALKNGDAKLFVAEDGFVIWTIRVCPRSAERTLWIWLAWGDGGRMIERYQDELTVLAQLAGAGRVAFSSPRRGYERALDSSWKPVCTEYERRVE